MHLKIFSAQKMVNINLVVAQSHIHLQCKFENSVQRYCGFTVLKANKNGWTSWSTNEDRLDRVSSATELKKILYATLATRDTWNCQKSKPLYQAWGSFCISIKGKYLYTRDWKKHLRFSKWTSLCSCTSLKMSLISGFHCISLKIEDWDAYCCQRVYCMDIVWLQNGKY